MLGRAHVICRFLYVLCPHHKNMLNMCFISYLGQCSLLSSRTVPTGPLGNKLLGNSGMLETAKQFWGMNSLFPTFMAVCVKVAYYLSLWSIQQWFFEIFSGSDHLEILLNTDFNPVKLGQDLRFCVSNKPGDTNAAGSRTTLRIKVPVDKSKKVFIFNN